MFSQDEYWGEFCPSAVIDCITGEATALINYTWWAASYPRIVLLRNDRCSSLPLSAPHSGLQLRYSTLRYIPPSQSALLLYAGRSSIFLLLHCRLLTSLPFRRCSAWIGCCAGYVLLNLRQHSLACICAPQFHSALLHHHRHSLLPTLHCTSATPPVLLAPLIFPQIHHIPCQTPFWFTTS